MIHYIFQRHHIPPHEIYSWTHGQKRFAYGSMALQLAEEEAERKRIERERQNRERRKR